MNNFLPIDSVTVVNITHIISVQDIKDRSGQYLLLTLTNGEKLKIHNTTLQNFLAEINKMGFK